MTKNRPLLPGSTIGIVGGGQLGRMLVLVARRMGYRTLVLDPDPAAPAGQVADAQIDAPLTDVDAARKLAAACDVVTLEWENADLGAVRALEEIVPVRPGAHVLEVAQNRLREKETARRLGLATADFRRVTSVDELRHACGDLGLPAVLKTATGGYDGKGQFVIRRTEDIEGAYTTLQGSGDLILEAWIPFRLEVSVICARSLDGATASFPVVENIHHSGILDFTLAPADLPDRVRSEATAIGETLAEGLGVIGLLAVEMFVTSEGTVLINELAPRPHNSGHYSIEACSVSQFEQQLRAVCGLPLAEPVLLRPAAMANLLGQHIGTGLGVSAVAEALREPMLHFHLYGKRESRPGRKMGHLTALADTSREAFGRVSHARALLEAELERITSTGTRADTPT